MTLSGQRPTWLTFDCYGTLIQWDEGLQSAVDRILATKSAPIDPAAFLPVFDRHEHALEQQTPHQNFVDVTAAALRLAFAEFGLTADATDTQTLTNSIGQMPPFPEVVATLGILKAAGFRAAIISNTDDAIIAGNVAQLGGHIDRVITAQQAHAYKPSPVLFRHAWRELGVTPDQIVHICASPTLDLTAARDLGFRAIWIDRGTGRQPEPDCHPAAILPTLNGVPGVFAEAGWI